MASQRNRAKKEWAGKIGARIPDQAWQQTRAAFAARIQAEPNQAPPTLDQWIEKALASWIDLGVQQRKKHHTPRPQGPASPQTIRLAKLTREQLHQAWVADGAHGHLGGWITQALLHATRTENPEQLPPPPARLPTWRQETKNLPE